MRVAAAAGATCLAAGGAGRLPRHAGGRAWTGRSGPTRAQSGARRGPSCFPRSSPRPGHARRSSRRRCSRGSPARRSSRRPSPSRCSGVRVVATDAATGALSAFGWDAAPPVVEALCVFVLVLVAMSENSWPLVAFGGLEPLVNAAESLLERGVGGVELPPDVADDPAVRVHRRADRVLPRARAAHRRAFRGDAPTKATRSPRRCRRPPGRRAPSA